MMLYVKYENLTAGMLEPNGDRIEFTYADEWLKNRTAFPLSRSLPLSGTYRKGTDDHRFFTNLLPEHRAREAICRKLGISVDNDYGLLRAIGGECAGALRIVPEGVPEPEEYRYEALSRETVRTAALARMPSARSLSGERARFSLAGSQDKWLVKITDGNLFLPLGSSPSTHILKFADPDYKGLPHNEAYLTFTAGRLGIPTVRVTPGDGYVLIERYDRVLAPDGTIVRLHQEDFCQALGYPPFSKYEAESGPALTQCFNLVRECSTSPAEDGLLLLRWQILNLLLGNADGHAKNVSLLYREGETRLAPFYDLVCTAVYADVSHELAMRIGGVSDPGWIGRAQWEAQAEQLGIRHGLLLRMVRELCSGIEAQLPAITEEFISLYGEDPVLERIRHLVADRVRRTRTLL